MAMDEDKPEIISSAEELDRLRREIERLRGEKERVRRERDDAETRYTASQTSFTACQTKVAELEHRIRRQAWEIEDLRSEIGGLKEAAAVTAKAQRTPSPAKRIKTPPPLSTNLIEISDDEDNVSVVGGSHSKARLEVTSVPDMSAFIQIQDPDIKRLQPRHIMDFLSKPLHSSRPPLESRASSSMQTANVVEGSHSKTRLVEATSAFEMSHFVQFQDPDRRRPQSRHVMDFLSKPLHSSRPPLESRASSSMQTNEENSAYTSSSRTGSLSTPGRYKRARSISPPIDDSTLRKVGDDETVIASSSKRPSRDLYTPVPPAMRTEGRAVNISELVSVTSVKERHNGSSWSNYREASAEKIQETRIARFARDNTPAHANAPSIAATASTDVQFALGTFPEPTDARPREFEGNAPAPSPAAGGFSQPPCAAPSHWLLHPSLENCYLDVVIKGAYAPSTRLFTDAVGVIRGLEKIKRNERGSVKVRFGRAICTDKWVPVKHVFPLTTTEYEGVTPRALARSILDVIGVRVVVIGADAKGRWDFVGKTGAMSSCGKVDIDGASILFPITSLCRSDPDPK